MASNTSKTARASVRAGEAKGGALSVLGEFKYLIPPNKGKHAHVRNLTNGKTLHLSTSSDAFVEEIRTLAGAGHAAKIRVELASRRSGYLPNACQGWRELPELAAVEGSSQVGWLRGRDHVGLVRLRGRRVRRESVRHS